MTKHLINVFGAMTTGKSTLVERLKLDNDRIYTVDYDVVKKQISGYYSARDSELATKITYDTLAAVAQTGLEILALVPPPKNQVTYLQIERIATENDYRLVNIELTAPLDVMVERYKMRLEALKSSGSDVAKLRTIEEFRKAVQSPYFIPENTATFDSSALTADEIYQQVKKLIKP